MLKWTDLICSMIYSNLTKNHTCDQKIYKFLGLLQKITLCLPIGMTPALTYIKGVETMKQSRVRKMRRFKIMDLSGERILSLVNARSAADALKEYHKRVWVMFRLVAVEF